MNTPLKKACIFGLAAGIGTTIAKHVRKVETDEQRIRTILWNSKEIQKAGIMAAVKSKVLMDDSLVLRTSEKLDQLMTDKEDIDILRILGVIFIGIQDLGVMRSKFHNPNPELEALEDACLNFLTVFDPNLEREDVYAAAEGHYERWVA
tara:strand:- start:621 stop:1067 length:447 start_codon:yes stop_codon:yes gene_type:complete